MSGSTAPEDLPAGAAPWPEASFAAALAATTRLVETMLHEVRNPLSTITTTLGVLGEKLKDRSGTVPPSVEKNLRTIGEQALRVNAILRPYAELLAVRSPQLAGCSLAEVVEHARQVLDHESRKRQVPVRVDLEPGLHVRLADPVALRFLVYQSLLRALLRSAPGGEVEVHLRREGDRAVLEVRDAGGGGEPDPGVAHALEALGRARSVEVSIQEGRCALTFAAR